MARILTYTTEQDFRMNPSEAELGFTKNGTTKREEMFWIYV